MTTGWTIENCAAHCMGIRDGNCVRSAPDALLTDDLVAPDAESGHPPPHRAGWGGRSRNRRAQPKLREQRIQHDEPVVASSRTL
jgi:hypothetical protein